MSLIDRIKRAKAKADKLGAKSKKAQKKGKEGRAARLKQRSEKKSEKADKMQGKLSYPKNTFPKSSSMMGAAFGTGVKNAGSSAAFQLEMDRLENSQIPSFDKPKPARKYEPPSKRKKK